MCIEVGLWLSLHIVSSNKVEEAVARKFLLCSCTLVEDTVPASSFALCQGQKVRGLEDHHF